MIVDYQTENRPAELAGPGERSELLDEVLEAEVDAMFDFDRGNTSGWGFGVEGWGTL